MSALTDSSILPESMGAKKFVYQIFYDHQSLGMLDPGFIPLDNTPNERPDWFEFWVIRKFLRENRLEEGAWYGFLSPRFKQKSGFNSDFVLSVLDRIDAHADVALFSPGPNVLAYFKNPFEQGEFRHPGLLKASQQFLDDIGFDLNVESLVTHSKNSAFCNYIIAKREYWARWLDIADQFFEYVEFGSGSDLAQPTLHEGVPAPMKTFVQERLSSLILARGEFKIFAPDLAQQLFHHNDTTRRSLIACDFLKERYSATNDAGYLIMYQKIRGQIEPQ